MRNSLVTLLLACAVSMAFPQAPAADAAIAVARARLLAIDGLLAASHRPAAASIDSLRSALLALRSTDAQGEENPLGAAWRRFEGMLASDECDDSLRSAFLEAAECVEFLFAERFLSEAERSDSPRMILFSASVSCACTRAMGVDQLGILYQFGRENGGGVRLAAVDTFVASRLQERYKVEFIPTVIVLDARGEELRRFVREEVALPALSAAVR